MNKYRDYIVLKSCLMCGELFVPNNGKEMFHSDNCRRLRRNETIRMNYKKPTRFSKSISKPEKLPSGRIRTRKINFAFRKYFGWKIDGDTRNKLGTDNFTSHLSRDKDGNPDFEKERMFVSRHKRRIFHPHLNKKNPFIGYTYVEEVIE